MYTNWSEHTHICTFQIFGAMILQFSKDLNRFVSLFDQEIQLTWFIFGYKYKLSFCIY